MSEDMTRIEALERNLLSLERFVHDLQKEIIDLKKAKTSEALDELVSEAQELKLGYE